MVRTVVFFLVLFLNSVLQGEESSPRKIFDVHIHGSQQPLSQWSTLKASGVYKAAVSTSWSLQNQYRKIPGQNLLFGLMLPCPEGRVPYSLQPCYDDGKDFPSPSWVEEKIRVGQIDFIGEVLSQYYGISPSDSSLMPYFKLAEKYDLPVGIHTGGAGPNHGSPNFQMEMGNPLLLKPLLSAFPNLKVWIMHCGDQHYNEAIQIMKEYPHIYADISVISNPDIVPKTKFNVIMKSIISSGMEDRIMFGTDNGNIKSVIESIESIDWLTNIQKDKIYFQNAERFFTRSK